MSLRCWLFGHEWLHLDTAFLPASSDTLRSQHLCDRCDERRTVVMQVWYFDDDDETPDAGLDYGDIADEKRENIKEELEQMKGATVAETPDDDPRGGV